MEEIIRNNIKMAMGEEGLKKAEIVAARAAIIASHDDDVDMSSLIIGLWVGNDGEMPETLQYMALGMVSGLAQLQMRKMNDPEMELR